MSEKKIEVIKVEGEVFLGEVTKSGLIGMQVGDFYKVTRQEVAEFVCQANLDALVEAVAKPELKRSLSKAEEFVFEEAKFHLECAREEYEATLINDLFLKKFVGKS